MMTSQEYRMICQLIKELESKVDSKFERFGSKVMNMLQGFSVLNPEKETMSSKEICEQYGISERKLCDMRKKGLIPFTKHGTAKNCKITYRVADVAEVFASRDEI